MTFVAIGALRVSVQKLGLTGCKKYMQMSRSVSVCAVSTCHIVNFVVSLAPM